MAIEKFVSDCDGGLYDSSIPNWHNLPALRPIYQHHYRDITNSLELRATLRAGGYTFPGGYELAFICADGGLLCFDCARSEYKLLGTPANNAKTWKRVIVRTVTKTWPITGRIYSDRYQVGKPTKNRIQSNHGQNLLLHFSV
jgi:hypothetical protein